MSFVPEPGMERKNTAPLADLSSHDSQTFSASHLPIEPGAISAASDELIAMAVAANGPLESRLKYLADVNNGSMIGLEFKIKPKSSLVRKMTKMNYPGMSLEELKDKQYDVLRYTMLLPIDRYVAAVNKVMSELKDLEQCTEYEVKNYWGCMTYRGINTIFVTKEGLKFELQFHTPESFDQKQNKTHILYEALRKETNAVKQHLFFLDMMSMWDNVNSPDGVESIGTSKRQDVPERKEVSQAEQDQIDRVWSMKECLRTHISQQRRHLKHFDVHILSCVEYASKLYGFHTKEIETRFKGALRQRRKVEEELRKKLGVHISKGLHEIHFPEKIDGLEFEDFLKALVQKQADSLMYKLVVSDENQYSQGVVGVLELMIRNGYILRSIDNFWEDQEKHHAISVTLEVTTDHRSVLHPLAKEMSHKAGCLFKMEFHTEKSYACVVERRTALAHIEEQMYNAGEAYNKAAADMQVRFDAMMLRHWAEVNIPPGALKIGTKCESVTTRVETENYHGWLTPAERRLRRIHAVSIIGCITLGAVLGVAGRGLLVKK